MNEMTEHRSFAGDLSAGESPATKNAAKMRK